MGREFALLFGTGGTPAAPTILGESAWGYPVVRQARGQPLHF